MAQLTPAAEAGELVTLLGDLARDGRKLLGQQLDLFRAEAGQELRRASGAAAEAAAGGGLVAAAGLLSALAVAHVIHKGTRLPLWASYGVAAGAAGAAGLALLKAGRDDLTRTPLMPQSAAALEENLEWLRDRVSPPAGE